MPALAHAGFHVIAPDQRGYGGTTGWDGNMISISLHFIYSIWRGYALGLVAALGHRTVAAVVGHDFGSPVAAWCALLRPDLVRSVVLLSAPFGGPPRQGSAVQSAAAAMAESLAALRPPRKHYQWYYSRARPTATCTLVRRVFMHSCAPTITSKVLIGRRISHSRLNPGGR